MIPPHIAERRAHVVVLRRLGRTLKEIGHALGVSRWTVRTDLKATGELCPRRPRRPPITERNRQVASAYLRGGVSLRDVAAEIGISVTAVHHHVARYRKLTGGRA